MKIKALCFILATLLPFGVGAETYVRFADHTSSVSEDQNDFTPTAAEGSNFFSVEYSTPGGDATSSDAPGKVYVPVDSNVQEPACGQSIQSCSHFRMSAAGGLPAMDGTAKLRIKLDLKNDLGESGRVYVAAKDTGDSDYKIFGKVSGDNSLATLNDGHESTTSLTMELADLCSLSFMGSNCTNLKTTKTTSINLMLYLFITEATSNFPNDYMIDPASETGGIYLQLFLSNKVPESEVSLVQVKKGDSRLALDFAGTSVVEMETIYAFYTTNVGDNPGDEFMSQVSGSVTRKDLETKTTTQTYDLKQLKNGQEYQVSVAFIDKFGFATKTSNAKTGSPVQIEEFLKSQSCYLISAGFGEEHFVIDYFKDFRDHFLQKYSWGRAFIKFYYGTAPEYALIIYKNEALSLIVRSFAYVLYFFFVFKGLPLIALIGAWCLRRVYVKHRLNQPQ